MNITVWEDTIALVLLASWLLGLLLFVSAYGHRTRD
jgi:hypothetical protein